MKNYPAFVCLLLLAFVLPSHGAEVAMPAEPETGLQLAQRIRAMMPDENSDFRGEFDIALKKKHRKVPVTCSVIVHASTWETIYNAAATETNGAERLIIKYSTNGPNIYLYARAASPSAPLPELAVVPSQKASNIPFAGSDFSIGDLGLDFLHWPDQQRLKGQMRLGQSCFVLESRDPQLEEIVRVRSFIDQESGKPLVAEGYDKNDFMVKQFSLHGSSFKKVNGHYRLEKIEIENNKTGSDTTLRFDLDSEAKP